MPRHNTLVGGFEEPNDGAPKITGEMYAALSELTDIPIPGQTSDEGAYLSPQDDRHSSEPPRRGLEDEGSGGWA